MAGIATATQAQALALRDALIAAERPIQHIAQGSYTGASATPAQVTSIDARLATLKAAVVAITG